jgi:hypothetical protein
MLLSDASLTVGTRQFLKNSAMALRRAPVMWCSRRGLRLLMPPTVALAVRHGQLIKVALPKIPMPRAAMPV